MLWPDRRENVRSDVPWPLGGTKTRPGPREPERALRVPFRIGGQAVRLFRNGHRWYGVVGVQPLVDPEQVQAQGQLPPGAFQQGPGDVRHPPEA